MLNLPYMGGYPQKVVGESSTQPVLFGVLGMFKGDQKFQALQQVVERPSSHKIPPVHAVSAATTHNVNTDRYLLGPAAKTHIPGIHYGMVPFPGRFMTQHGHIEVYGKREKHSAEDE